MASQLSGISAEELQTLIDGQFWKLDPVFHSQLQNRALELEDGGLGFDDYDFWFGEQNYLTPAQTEQLLGGDFSDQTGAGKPFDYDNDIVISEQFMQKTKTLRTTEMCNTVRFKNTDRITDNRDFCHNALTKVTESVLAGVEPSSLVALTIKHPNLDHDISFPATRRDQLNAETIAQRIEDVQQSNTEFNLDEAMEWITRIVEPISGAGPDEKRKVADLDWEHPGRRRKRYKGRKDLWFKDVTGGHNSCVLKIENNDNLCLARALVTARCRAEHMADKEDPVKKREWENVRKGDVKRNTHQRKQAQQLMKDAGLEGKVGPCDLGDLAQLHSQLKYRISVYSAETYNTCVYEEGTGPRLNLFHDNSHFHVITSMAAFFDSAYFCHVCQVGYSDGYTHTVCEESCPSCFESPQCKVEVWHACDDCNRCFRNAVCYARHLEVKKTNSTCKDVKRCRKCNVVVRYYQNRTHKHECGKVKCKNCMKLVDITVHQCHMQQAAPPKPLCRRKKQPSFIYFDFETTQSLVVKEDRHGEVRQHEVNCASYEKTCDLCYKQNWDSCKNCGPDNLRRTITGTDALEQFCNWVFTPTNEGSYLIAHNAGGFDGQFILHWMQNNTCRPTITMRGLKIMTLEVGGIKMIDSLNFLPMALSTLPKALGFAGQKGYFPHYFNEMANMDYVGPVPPPEDYGIHTMKAKPRADFEKWYDEQEGKTFVFKDELVKYCRMDVDILMEGCMIFRRMFLDKLGFDPFTVSITIASLSMYAFRLNHLPIDKIAIVPNGGYRKDEKHSVAALKWLGMESIRTGKRILHARNGGEQRVLQFKVDGKLDNEMVVFEYHGCVYHGCPACFPDHTKKLPMSNQTAGDAYQRTIARQKQIEAQGYTVITMWECELKAKLRMPQHRAEKEIYDNIIITEPMDPRDALYGGRTNCRRMYYKCKIGEKMYYIDVCSLYPFVCKYGSFPVGHPVIVTENFEPIDQRTYNGLIKARVLVPKDLYHPVLPYRSQGKLLFPVCRTCADTRNSDVCNHSEQERALEGTWATVELYKAMDKGCRVVHIYEIYHYTQWEQYDGSDESTGFFSSYINTNLKMKQEASGWPEWVKTEEDKVEYVRRYKEHEGIDLDPAKIVRNEALRAIAKLLLNAFWGKFGQRSGMSNSEYFSEVSKYLKCVFDAANIVESIQILNEQLVYVQYSTLDEYVEDKPSNNVVIASIVTALARLELYKYLEKLEDRVAYMDTDSVIYITRPGDDYDPVLGDFLGQMTDELDGGVIDEFVSLGPKQYAFTTVQPDQTRNTVCKVRGVTLNSTISRKLDFHNMKRLIKKYLETGEKEEITVDTPYLRKTGDRLVMTRIMTKTCKIVYDKCKVLPCGQTVPFGYSV